jgi:hypothetical protein
MLLIALHVSAIVGYHQELHLYLQPATKFI